MKKRFVYCLITVLYILTLATGCSFLPDDIQPGANGSEASQNTDTDEADNVAEAQDPKPSAGNAYPEIIPEKSTAPEEMSDGAEGYEEADESVVVCPKYMEHILSGLSVSATQLSDIGCSQLIIVDSSGSEANICFFSLFGSEWTEDETLRCKGYVGVNGVNANKHEGDGTTPQGLYRIGDAFYIFDKPETGLDMFEISSDTYWVDDPDSRFYNKRVEGREEADWKSAEHMLDFQPAYNYGFVIEYNAESEYGVGSAIFFHVGAKPSSGCVAVDEDALLAILAVLDKNSGPCIAIA